MENNSKPKKSKALIITFIIVLLLLIIGYFLFTNSDKIFGTKGVINFNKIFSPLATSDNSKNLTTINAVAGEDITKGDNVSVSGKDANGNPIVVKTSTSGGTVYGYANQNIQSGSTGPIITSSPSLWSSFTNFIGNLFGGNNTTNQTTSGTWSTGDNGKTGTFTGSNGTGTWVATNGTGGTGIVTWAGTGNGTGTWTSSTGSGTWTNGTGTGGAGTGTWGTVGTGSSSSSSYTTGNWSTENNGNTGTFTGSNGTGTWTTTSGTGGIGNATWTGTGNGTGTWTSSTGSGTWTNGTGTGGAGTGTWGTVGTGGTGSSSSYNTANGWSYNYLSGTWTPPASSTLPSVTLTATPSSVVSGAKSVIAWTSTNTTSCNAGITGRTKGTSGTFNTAALTTGTSYSVTCIGPKGSSTSSVYVGISTGTGSSSGYNNGVNNLTVTVNATPLSVEPGSSSDISWYSTNTTSCNAGITGRTKGTSGTFNTGALTKGKEYSVTCIGTNGSSSGNVIVSVIGENDPPIVSAIANPSLILPNTKSVITWTSKNTTSCNADVATRTKGISGTFTTPALTGDTAYSITCVGPNGSSSTTVYVFVNTNGIVTTCPYGGTPPNCLNAPIGSSSSYNICTNGTDNYPTCTTINGKCQNGATNPPLCTEGMQPCPVDSTGTYPFCILKVQTCENLATLEFTPEQQADLEALLRRYYLLSEKIKSENDIIQLNNDLDKTNSLIARTEDLTKQCFDEKSKSSYTGPQSTRQGNPWYPVGTEAYNNSVWLLNPYNAQTPHTPLNLSKYGFNEFPRKLWDLTGNTKYYDNWMASVNNKDSSYLNHTDWAQLNADANLRVANPNDYWTSNDGSATPAVIEYLFKIW